MKTDSFRPALAIALACVMVLSVAVAGPVSAADDGQDGTSDDGSSDSTDSGTTYHLEQGDECFELVPLQDDKSVSEFYDWAPDDEHEWSSQGTTHLQRAETSLLFLYEDPDGTVSLVIVHEKVGDDGGDGGSASFSFQGMPNDGSWVVRDDDYNGSSNYDNWDTEGSSQSVDWTWDGNRTDGGAYESLGDDFQIKIDPAFNEDAELEDYDGTVEHWELLSDDQSDPERYRLDMSREVQIGTGPCRTDDNSGTNSYPRFEVTDESINRTNVTVGEPVEVTVNVTNEGTASGEYAALFQSNFDLVKTKRAEIGVDETETFTFETRFDEPGTYTIKVRTNHIDKVQVHPRPDSAAD